MADLKKLKPKELVEMEPQPEQRAEIRRRLERLEKFETTLRKEAARRKSLGADPADLRCDCWMCELLRAALEE